MLLIAFTNMIFLNQSVIIISQFLSFFPPLPIPIPYPWLRISLILSLVLNPFCVK